MAYNYSEEKNLFTTPSEIQEVNPAENFDKYSTDTKNLAFNSKSKSVISPMAPPFQTRRGNDFQNFVIQEPQTGDTAPQMNEIDEAIFNYRLNSSESMFNDTNNDSKLYNSGSAQSSPDLASSNGNLWSSSGQSAGPRSLHMNDNFDFLKNQNRSDFDTSDWNNTNGISAGAATTSKNYEVTDSFDFVIKTLTSASNYVSMLTREQLFVLQSIRPSLLYELLQEVARIRFERRPRRVFHTDCAFCKNNGENEECYSTHTLKDGRGRVLCPVLRAFHCPRCGATGERAHTIKYCPEAPDVGAERCNLSSRRRFPQPISLMLGSNGVQVGGKSNGMNYVHSAPQTPIVTATPAPSPAASGPFSMWAPFGIN